jgi:integrase
MKNALTVKAVKEAKPQDRPYKMYDGEGLFLYVSKTGAKSWRYKYRIDGKEQTYTFGRFPDISLSRARELHAEAKKIISTGRVLPSKKAGDIASKGVQRFSYYMLQSIEAGGLAESTKSKKLSRCNKYLFPKLDRFDPTKITGMDILDIVKPLVDRGNIESAHYLITYCKQAFNQMIYLGLLVNNPARDIAAAIPKPAKATQFPHIVDESLFRRVVQGIDQYKGEFAVKSALQIMPYLFLRPSNIRFMRWEWVDLDNNLITYPAEAMKTRKPHMVPLAPAVKKVIAGMVPLTGESDLVFSVSGKPMSENTLNMALTRVVDPLGGKAFGRGVITSHGFRHTASTFLNERGYSADVIELQLAHSVLGGNALRGVYNKATIMPERVKMMNEWAAYIDELRVSYISF